MSEARTTYHPKMSIVRVAALAIVPALAAVLLTPKSTEAAAGGVQDCTVGSTCVIGEFLFDDTSSPINDATCTIVTYDPSDSIYLNTSMDTPTQSDGWYSKSFTAPSTTGFYRTTVSCTTGGDTLSIDKSFQVNSASSSDPSAVAAAVWGYSTRTISSFGTLVSDIWDSATRTLTGVGLSSGQLATQDDVVGIRNQINNLSTDSGDLATIKKNTSETRLLMEKVVNKPIIENVLEDTTPSISEKIDGSRAQANQLYVNNQFLTAQAATLASSWDNLSGKEALDSVISMAGVLGEMADSSSTNSMFGSANWIKDSWNWQEGTDIYNQLGGIYSQISDLKSGLANYQKSAALKYEVRSLVRDSLALERMIGSTTDSPTSKSLFAKIKSTEALAANIDSKSQKVDSAIASYQKNKDTSGIADLDNQVIALNKIPGATSAIYRINFSDPTSVINNLLSLKGILVSNLKMLALGAGKTMVNVWLEVGSIVFKTIATNPSTLVSQDVEIKYYLPAEIKKEDVIKTDAGLTVDYDVEKDQLYVTGTFNLDPGQTRTFSIETKDIWAVTASEIESIRKQADELYKPLDHTAYYAQGVALRSDINAAMDQVETLQSNTATPEDKIKAYREAVILKKSAEDKLAGLKDLVTQASATGSLFGFVGGSQTIAVWGLIIIIAAGFIFMTVYMRTVIARAKKGKSTPAPSTKAKKSIVEPNIKPVTHVGKTRALTYISVLVGTSLVSAVAAGLIVKKNTSVEYEQKLSVLGTTASAPQATSTPVPSLEPPATPGPLKTDTLNGNSDNGTGGPYLVTVADAFTGSLDVMRSPSGEKIAEVTGGDKMIYLNEVHGWYNVQLEDGTTGWVSSKYTIKE